MLSVAPILIGVAMKAKVSAVNILDAGDNFVDAIISISCVYKSGDHARQPRDKAFLKTVTQSPVFVLH